MSTAALVAMIIGMDESLPDSVKALLSQLAEVYNGDFEYIPTLTNDAVEFVFEEHDSQFTLVVYRGVVRLEFYFASVRNKCGTKYNISNMKYRNSNGYLKNESYFETINEFVKNIGIYIRHGIILHE
jgi:hypothetical protein